MAEDCKILYFYENGHPCEPQKITKHRCKLLEVICRDENEGHYTYKGKNIYTLDGEQLFAFRTSALPVNTGYVLVGKKEAFKVEDYITPFVEMLKKQKILTCDIEEEGEKST